MDFVAESIASLPGACGETIAPKRCVEMDVMSSKTSLCQSRCTFGGSAIGLNHPDSFAPHSYRFQIISKPPRLRWAVLVCARFRIWVYCGRDSSSFGARNRGNNGRHSSPRFEYDGQRYDFVVQHDPCEHNYQHCEIRVFNQLGHVTKDVNKAVKKYYRYKVAEAATLLLRPETATKGSGL